MFSERSFILTVWLVCICMYTESVSWPETHVWSSRPHYKQLQRLSVVGKTQGASCPPCVSHGAQPAHCSLRRELHSRTPPHLLAQTLYCVPSRGALKAMAPHSSTLAWNIRWTEVPGRLQSMGLLRVGHDWATSLSLFPFMHWRSQWQPTPVLLPGESQGRMSLVGCHLWGRTESDTTEAA